MGDHLIRNPILPGFHPDPSIIRVGDDYYLATSTFEWFPGVALFHSRDLAHWRPIGHVATRRAQLDLRGIGDSAGLWAPSLSFDGARFYLIVCNVRSRLTNFKDMQVMLFTAEHIDGPWSEPAILNGMGFDPSLFHDPDTGRKWVCNIQWDARPGKYRFAGNYIQEYDPRERRLIGPPIPTVIKPNVLCEGPNLYKVDGWYYLMMAQGGTGWNHGISMARARQIEGPYELDPQPLVITSRKSPGNVLQKAGHGELVQTQAGEWYLVHLASRVSYPDRRSLLGRETCLQKVAWSDDGWLRLAHGGTDPLVEVSAPTGLTPHPFSAEPERDDFDRPTLSPHWQSLRVPVESSWVDLESQPGTLRLRGRESLHSLFDQSLLARRLESFVATAETCVRFDPTHYTQSAGLIVYYDTRTHFYLRVTHDEQRGRVLGVVQTDDGAYAEGPVVPVEGPRVFLRATLDGDFLRFSASPDGRAWQTVGAPIDQTKLSDDYGAGMKFTGPMIGICCQDLNQGRAVAEFDHFELRTQ